MVDSDLNPLYDVLNKDTETDVYSSVKQALNKVAKKEGYINHKIYKRIISSEGGNYLGVLYEVNIEGNTARGHKKTNLFVKHVLHNGENVKFLSISEIYAKEAFAYGELSKIFTDLQNKANVPADGRFKMVKSYDESVIDAIILDNMSKKGFKTFKKMDIMLPKFAQLAVQQLARFHGLSFVMEKQMPEYFETKIKSLDQSLQFDDDFRKFAAHMYEISSKKFTPDIKKKFDKRFDALLENYVKSAQGSLTSVKCLCHGDFKMNNILYKEIEGEVAEVVTVDYQLLYYGSPVTDLIVFLITASDREFRKKYFRELKDLYYESMEKFLKYFDILVEEIYPRNMYERDFENCLDYGLVLSVTMLPLLFTADDDTPDLSKDDLMDTSLQLTILHEFYDRVQGIVEDFIEWGHL